MAKIKNVEVKKEEVVDVKPEVAQSMDLGSVGKAKIVEIIGSKEVGQQKYNIVKCDDGCTYDVPVE